MMFRKIEKTVASTDGVHTLRGAVYLPDGEIKGLVQIVHGMQEHIGRYEPFMAYLAQRGFLVFGYDHLAMGRQPAPTRSWGTLPPSMATDIW